MKCMEAKLLFSPYLDGALTGHQMRHLSGHIASCAECSRHYRGLRQTQQMIAGLGKKQAPPELALRLRVALSQEIAAGRQRNLNGMLVRFQDALNGIMVPATAGVVSAIIFFGLLIGVLAMPAPLRASNDVPTMLYTPPQLKDSQFSVGLGGNVNADAVVVEAYVDANGRIQDYRILSGPKDARDYVPELENMLIFTEFHPATAFGRPTSGKTVLSFSMVNVKG